MARGITKEDYITAYNVLNAQINSTSNMKLTKHEKAILHDFLYNAKDGDKEKDMEPFVREHLLGGDNDSTFKEIDRSIDPRFILPRIFSHSEENYVKESYRLKNSISRVALTRVLLKFSKVGNIRISFGTAKFPLRHGIFGR